MGVFLIGDEAGGRPRKGIGPNNGLDPFFSWAATFRGDCWRDFRCSSSIEEVTGYSARVFRGNDAFRWPDGLWFKLVHVDDRKACGEAWAQLVQGTDCCIEHRIEDAAGRLHSVVTRASVWKGSNGIELAGTVTDITRRKAEEEEHFRLQRSIYEGAMEWRLMFDAVESPILVLDFEGHICGMNRAAREVSDRPYEENLGQAVENVGPGELWQKAAQVVSLIRSTGTSTTCEARDELSGRTWEIVGGLFKGSGIGDRITLVAHNISKRKRAEEALQLSEEHFRSLIENSSDVTTILNADGTIRYESPSVERILGYAPEDLIGKNLFDFIHPDDAADVLNAFTRKTEVRNVTAQIECRFWHKDNYWCVLEATGKNMVDDPALSGIVINSRDITTRKQAEEQLLHDALHDSLTGLSNRTLFVDRLNQSIARSKRHPGYLFAVLFLDLDRFKLINDSLGHMLGDRLLTATAGRLESCLRSCDTVARFGGDEFTILLDDIEDTVEATQLANRIHERLSAPFNLDGQRLYVTASIGIALSTTGYRRAEEVLRGADTAMYRAKSLGRSCYQVFDKAMHTRAVTLMQLESDLWQAIELGQFRVYYQPIISLQTAGLAGFEALVRWQHPSRGLVLPEEFIRVAEETKLIVPIGRQILLAACLQLKAWQQHMLPTGSLSVSVNLSGRQLAQPDLIEQVTQILSETGLDPHNLKLEITESVIMENAESTIRTLEQLRSLGIHLQIDDFGTGYSSLSYLHRFPIDTLKIDRSFVSRMTNNCKNSEIVGTIITLARNLGMGVIAEGVETAEQLRHLEQLNCDYAQGFLFSRPIDSLAAGGLIRSRPIFFPRTLALGSQADLADHLAVRTQANAFTA
jgi:diguanylate cyclase (GGDEF)-like protein/PAS domain S-box-containing protein